MTILQINIALLWFLLLIYVILLTAHIGSIMKIFLYCGVQCIGLGVGRNTYDHRGLDWIELDLAVGPCPTLHPI